MILGFIDSSELALRRLPLLKNGLVPECFLLESSFDWRINCCCADSLCSPGARRDMDAGARSAAELVHPSRVPGLRHLFALWRLLRRWFSRREWTVRLLGLPVSRGTSDEPGLIVLQIDGLSRVELERAVRQGRLPFIRQLIDREHYRLHTLYSGQPATTPAVLGELFYGVRQAVPAFAFRDHRTQQVVEMFQPEIAATLQSELEQKGTGLLQQGSAYCTIYAGGAAESQFCPSNIGWKAAADAAAWKKAAVFLWNIAGLLRVVWSALIEIAVSLFDAFRGKIARREWWTELKFIPRRVIGSAVLRELTAIGAESDAIRGLPVIYANFLGYDELAHRRGPASWFAHTALRGTDRALRRIWNAAQGSRRRDYRVWVLSDHGQETTRPYDQECGKNVREAIEELYRQRVKVRGIDSAAASAESSPASSDIPTVVAIGPLGYVYWPDSLDPEGTEQIAREMVSQLQIPLVLARLDEQVYAWNKSGRYRMPDEAEHVLAPDHPHLPQVADDFSRLCCHPDAGHFVISGWRNRGLPLSFVMEHGAHGGPGPRETSGFVLLPPDVRNPETESLRPLTVRKLAQSVLSKERRRNAVDETVAKTESIRIVTYNVHSCIGLDGRLSPARIARVLASLSPDVVALQELDVVRARTGLADQAHAIAAALEMEFHFHASLRVAEEQYGNAVLSRFPMRKVRGAALPRVIPGCEPRGALWVELQIHGQPLNLISTHLGLSTRERMAQIDALLGPEWIGHPECRAPVVFCGDLNAMPRSVVYRRLAASLKDAALQGAARARSTWFGPWPLTRIDHVFVSPDIHVRHADVFSTALSRVASDHLPVVVDIEIVASETQDEVLSPERTSEPSNDPVGV